MHFKQQFEELRGVTDRPADIDQTTGIAAVEAAVTSMAAAIIVLTTTGRYGGTAIFCPRLIL